MTTASVNGAMAAAGLSPGDALLSYRFSVEVDQHDIGTWLTCEMGGVSADARALKDGGNGEYKEQLPGMLQWKPIVLTRYVNADTRKVQQWIQSMSTRSTLCTGRVRVLSHDGIAHMVFEFRRARIVSWTLPSLDSGKMSAAVETLTIAHDGYSTSQGNAVGALGGSPSVSESRPNRQRAQLTISPVSGAKRTLRCHFNPESLTVAKSATWEVHRSEGETHVEPVFKRSDPRSLSLKLTLDGTGASDPEDLVLRDTELLLSCCDPPEGATGQTRAPTVLFSWGQKVRFDAVVASVNVTYTEFWPSGLPYRADVSLSLTERKPKPAGTNPTSGGPPGKRMRLFAAGDSLASIAWEEYRDPTLWRAIVDANAIEDPLRVRPGTVLQLPSSRDAALARARWAEAAANARRAEPGSGASRA